MENNFQKDEAFSYSLDASDPLSDFKTRFYFPDKALYFDGNSLGLPSKESLDAVTQVVNEWRNRAIGGWMQAQPPWYYTGEYIGAMTAPLVGAGPEEVVLTGATTINIHSLIGSFYNPQGIRTRILADSLTFPSDIYALKGQISIRGYDPDRELVLATPVDHAFLDEDAVIDRMDDTIALVFLPSVLYRSGQLLDMKKLIAAAHERNISIGFDCCHSVGAIPHYFDEWGVDFAVWCSYKYLNGGPGAPAFLYVNEKHFHKKPLLMGWWGNDKRTQFDMNPDFVPAHAAGRWQISSPSILSAAPLLGSIPVIREAGIDKIRQKSLQLTSYLIYLVDEMLTKAPYNFTIGTPRTVARRGGHVTLEHKEEAVRINEALRAHHIIGDFRPPCCIRIAPVALYTSFHDVWVLAQVLKTIIDDKEYAAFPKQRNLTA